jgi:AAHS family 4-hydroxybenzoate transporter-like MFS transporter
MKMNGRTIDVTEVIDCNPVGGLQKLVIGLCACLVFFDGFDAQVIGYVAPVISNAWHLPAGALGPTFSAGLIGLMMGALGIAPLADQFGRRPIIIASTCVFGLLSLATAGASSITSLFVLRFLTGLGLGGCMPNAIALTSEYSPHRRRSMLVILMFIGFTLGSLCAGMVSTQLIQRYGWPAVFMVGGILPLLAVLLLFFALPESIDFLVLTARKPREIGRLMRRLAPGLSDTEGATFSVRHESTQRVSLKLLFRDECRRNTLLLWVIFFMSLLDIYLLVSWLPTTVSSTGATIRTAILVGMMLQIGGLVSSLPMGWIIDRFSARAALAPAYLVAALCIAIIGKYAGGSTLSTLLVVFGAGAGILGGQNAANAVAAMTYPTLVRSTGVGWALGIGRIGSIIGPIVAGILIGRHVSLQNIFLLSSIPALCAALAALGLAPNNQPAVPAASLGVLQERQASV